MRRVIGGIVVLSLIGLLGVGYGIFRGVREQSPKLPPIMPTETLTKLPETERPQRLQAMRRALEVFYANPDETSRLAARDAIFAYRRTFPDADPKTLGRAEPKIECGSSAECEMKNAAQKKRMKEIVDRVLYDALYKQLFLFPSKSPEFRINAAMELAQDWRTDVAPVLAWVTADLGMANQEKVLDGIRGRFFDDIDGAVKTYNTSRDATVVPPLTENLNFYARAAEATFKKIKPGRICPPEEKPIKDGQLCEAAVTAIANAARADQATRIAAAKEAIKNRDAPLDALRIAIQQIFR